LGQALKPQAIDLALHHQIHRNLEKHFEAVAAVQTGVSSSLVRKSRNSAP